MLSSGTHHAATVGVFDISTGKSRQLARLCGGFKPPLTGANLRFLE
jgi:hypothetical protein